MEWPSRKCEAKGLPFFWSDEMICIEAKEDRFNREMVRVEVSVAVSRPTVLRQICCVTMERGKARSLCWLAIQFARFLRKHEAPKGHLPNAPSPD